MMQIASVVVRDDDFVRCAWFAQGDDLNMLAVMRRVRPAIGFATGSWELIVNVRLFLDDQIWNSKDERIAFAADAPRDATESVAVSTFEAALHHARRELKIGGELHRVEVNGGPAELAAAISNEPWAHVRAVGGAEA